MLSPARKLVTVQMGKGQRSEIITQYVKNQKYNSAL